MTSDELDAALSAIQPSSVQVGVRRSRAVPTATEVTDHLMRRLTQGNAGEPTNDAERQLQARRELYARQLASERAKLEPRIKRWLLERISKRPTACALLLGQTGVGKTSAMRWLALQLGPRAYEVRASRLGSAPRRHVLGGGDAPEVDRARTTQLLCLDDVGTEEARDVGTLQEVIDYRYSRGLPTIATSGLTKDQLSETLGAPYVRRLLEQHVPLRAGGYRPVLFVDGFDIAR